MLSPGLQAISSTLVLEFLSLWLYSKVYLVENTSCIEFKKSSVPNKERSILEWSLVAYEIHPSPSPSI